MPFEAHGNVWDDCVHCKNPPTVKLYDGVTMCKCRTYGCPNNLGDWTSETNGPGPLLARKDGSVLGPPAWEYNARVWNAWNVGDRGCMNCGQPRASHPVSEELQCPEFRPRLAPYREPAKEET